MPAVTVRLPATSANLGPGFDCLGLALDLWNEVHFSLEGQSYNIENQGEGAASLPSDGRSLVIRAALQCWRAAGRQFPAGLTVRAANHIPTGSGLGSSAAAILAGLLGANRLLEDIFSQDQILAMANRLEGHPDNLAAALSGGLTAAAVSGGRLIQRRFDVPPLRVVVALPDFHITTRQARAALPAQVALKDAIFNIGRTPLVVDALARGDLELLGAAMEDHLHQARRFALIPGAEAACLAARRAGAAAAALSGAGPAVIAFGDGGLEAIAGAMLKAFNAAGLQARAILTTVSNQGAQVIMPA